MGQGTVLCAAILSSLGAFLFGLDIGYIAPILECASFKRDVGHLKNWQSPEAEISSGTVGFIVGVFSLGCIVVSFPPVSSYFLDSWGRKGSILLGSGVFLVGSLLQFRASSINGILLGRLVAGGSIGLLSTVVALYQSEVSPPHLRGTLTSLYQLMVTFGILVAAAADVPLVAVDGGWRLAIALQAAPAMLLFVGIIFLPRSPRWLAQQSRTSEAYEVLLRLRDTKEEAEREFQEIVASVQEARQQPQVSAAQAFQGRVGKLLAVGVALQVLQQLVGMNAFMYFGPRLFQSLNFNTNVFQTVTNMVNFFSTLPALYLIEVRGRRSLLVSGAIGMLTACLCMGALGEALTARAQEGSALAGGAMALLVFMFVASFACSWGPTVWVYTAEIFPMSHRSWCVGLTTMSNWVGNYLIAQFTPVLFDTLGMRMFFVFGLFSFAALLLARWMPETKGLPLESIDKLFDAKFGLAETRGGLPPAELLGVECAGDVSPEGADAACLDESTAEPRRGPKGP